MADTVGSAAGKATGGLSGVARSEAVDRLKSELQSYLGAQAERALAGLGRKLGETTGKLNDIAEGNSPGFAKLALDGGRKLAEGKGPLRSALEVGAGRAKDSVTDAFKNLTGGKGKRKGGGAGQKPTVILSPSTWACRCAPPTTSGRSTRTSAPSPRASRARTAPTTPAPTGS
jgi:hypothetical protein